jgi:hypothetical protein
MLSVSLRKQQHHAQKNQSLKKASTSKKLKKKENAVQSTPLLWLAKPATKNKWNFHVQKSKKPVAQNATELKIKNRWMEKNFDVQVSTSVLIAHAIHQRIQTVDLASMSIWLKMIAVVSVSNADHWTPQSVEIVTIWLKFLNLTMVVQFMNATNLNKLAKKDLLLNSLKISKIQLVQSMNAVKNSLDVSIKTLKSDNWEKPSNTVMNHV